MHQHQTNFFKLNVPIMKKRAIYLSVLTLALFLTAGVATSRAQVSEERIGYVNPQEILQRMPEMKAVQQRLENFISDKQQELSKKQQDLQQQIEDYQSKQAVLSEDAKQQTEEQLGQVQAELQQARRQAQQEIQQKQQELVSPLIEEINSGIEAVAKEKNLSYVLNTTTSTGDVILLYVSNEAEQKFNITDEVMSELGI